MPTLETRTRPSAPVAQTDPVPCQPAAQLRVQQFGDHVGQPHRQQDGNHEQENGDLRHEEGQWEGPVHVDAEGGCQVTVAARGGWGETTGHCLQGPCLYPENNTEMRALDRHQDSKSHICPLNFIHPESAFLLCILAVVMSPHPQDAWSPLLWGQRAPCSVPRFHQSVEAEGAGQPQASMRLAASRMGRKGAPGGAQGMGELAEGSTGSR